MILQGEAAILMAARDRLRGSIQNGGAGYDERECDVELDEQVPAINGKRYMAVMPGGFSPGQYHNKSAGVFDLVYSLSVLVVLRINFAPRDKTRDIFLGNLGSFAIECDRCIETLDFKYETNMLANGTMLANGGTGVEYVEPLKFSGIITKPEVATSELFGGDGSARQGIKRTIFFTGARLVTPR